MIGEQAMLERLDFWLTIFVLALLFWAKFGRLITPLFRHAGGRVMSRPILNRVDTNYCPEPPKQTVLPDTHQPDTLSVDELIDLLTQHKLTREQAIKLLSKLRNPMDEHWLSANKISSSLGGTNAENMAAIAEYRPKPHAPPPPQTMRRPRGGW